MSYSFSFLARCFGHMNHISKQNQKQKVPLETADTRMTELIKQCTVFEAEMRLVHKKSVESRVYQFLTNYLSVIKNLMYVFCVLYSIFKGRTKSENL